MRECCIQEDAGYAFGQFLSRCFDIADIDLSDNRPPFSETGIQNLMSGVGDSHFPHLTTLNVDRRDIQEDAVAAFGQFLARCHNINEINLSANHLLFPTKRYTESDDWHWRLAVPVPVDIVRVRVLHPGRCRLCLRSILDACTLLTSICLTTGRFSQKQVYRI